MSVRYFAGKSDNTWYQKPPEIRHAYKEKLGYKICNGCKEYYKPSKLTIDHIILISRGGPVEDISNMQLLCFYCHRGKTRMEREEEVNRKEKNKRPSYWYL